ncbi:MAG: hypothetical protein AB1422_12930 [bacterium]
MSKKALSGLMIGLIVGAFTWVYAMEEEPKEIVREEVDKSTPAPEQKEEEKKSPLWGISAEKIKVEKIVQLTTDGGVESIQFSPDGKKIVISGRGETWIMDADGKNKGTLSKNALPNWIGKQVSGSPLYSLSSPDGTKIIELSHDKSHKYWEASPYRLGKIKNLTTGKEIIFPTKMYSSMIQWSPDGQKIYYNAPGAYSYIIDVNGTILTRFYHDGEFVWAPDSIKVAYSDMEIEGDLGDLVGSEIYVMNAKGTGKIQLTKTPGKTGIEVSPVWSPDASKILYRREYDGNYFVLILGVKEVEE